VFLMALEGKAALAEYLQLIIPVSRLLRAVFSSRIYQYFVAAAPGLKELMTLGKIWYEIDRCDEATGRRLWIWSFSMRRRPGTVYSTCACRRPRAMRSRRAWSIEKRNGWCRS